LEYKRRRVGNGIWPTNQWGGCPKSFYGFT
jgi:hypothetical protein